MKIWSAIKNYFQHLGSTSFEYTYDYRKTPIKGISFKEMTHYMVQAAIMSAYPFEENKLPIYMFVDGKFAPKHVGYWRYNSSPEMASSLVLVGHGSVKNRYLRGRDFDLRFMLQKDRVVIYLLPR